MKRLCRPGIYPQAPGFATPLNFLLHFSQSTHFRTMSDTTTPTRFGFVAFAETWNGRLAMMGFVIGLATELLTGQGILGQIGLG